MSLLILFLFITLLCHAEELPNCDQLFRDLHIVDYWNTQEKDSLPLVQNNYLRIGYINMPSARMREDGAIALGYSHVPPYRNYSAALQLFPFCELTATYRIFRGVEDINLSPYGFGDFSDKGADIKLQLFSPDNGYSLTPGVSVGIVDFMGTRAFSSEYIVCTQTLPQYDIEWSIGYGSKRLNGLFGGVAWSPWRHSAFTCLQPLTFVGEYDAIDYPHDPHPQGRTSKSPVNIGCHYQLGNYLDVSVSRIRGQEVATSVVAHYPFGNTTGLLPKCDDPSPYYAPINSEPIGIHRSDKTMIHEIAHALQDQGVLLLKAYIRPNDDTYTYDLSLHVMNDRYAYQRDVLLRLARLLAALIPSNIDKITVVIEAKDIHCQEYLFYGEHLRRFREKQISLLEIHTLTPLREIGSFDNTQAHLLFQQHKTPFTFQISPRTRTVFGSSTGKFKYSLGLSITAHGHIYDSVYYFLSVGKRIFANLDNNNDCDRINPSQLINVRSDEVRYEQTDTLLIDSAFLQKNWSIGKGWYAKISGGLFEQAFGGIATEILYYPVNISWALGVEGALLKKRKVTGLGFTKEIRRLIGWDPVYEPYTGRQYFLALHKNIPTFSLDCSLKAGQFLAHDRGLRTEITRYFPSGLRISLWYTLTDGHDRLNGKTYYDKGVLFSMPIDIFYTTRSRETCGHGMSAWLRDVGAISTTGISLFDILSTERR